MDNYISSPYFPHRKERIHCRNYLLISFILKFAEMILNICELIP